MEKYFDEAIKMAIAYAPKVLLVIILWMIGTWAINKVAKFADKSMKRTNTDESLRPFVVSMIGIGLKILLVLALASTLNIAVTSFVAVLGAMTFAIGMALQGSLGNFAGGVMLLLFRPFKVGDLITAQGHTGFVREIQIFNTIIMTPDNKKIIIPNGPLSNGIITNISGQGIIRVDMTFGIGYGDDIDKARKVIKQVVDNCPVIDHTKATDIFVSELGDSSVNFTVRPWADSSKYWDVYFYLNENIKKAFDREKVGIPYPTMDLNIVASNTLSMTKN